MIIPNTCPYDRCDFMRSWQLILIAYSIMFGEQIFMFLLTRLTIFYNILLCLLFTVNDVLVKLVILLYFNLFNSVIYTGIYRSIFFLKNNMVDMCISINQCYRILRVTCIKISRLE